MQTVRPLEVIIVDDCSDDGTQAELMRYGEMYPNLVRLIFLNENIGVAGARNCGWEAATQPLIAFLDSDDAWHPQKIEIQFSYMNDNPGVDICGHDFEMILTGNNIPNWKIVDSIKSKEITNQSLLISNPFVTPSVMLRGKIKDRFIDNQRHMEDHMLWMQVALNGGKIHKISLPLVATYKKSFGESGLSSQLLKMQFSDLRNYKNLLRMGCINYWQWVFYSILSCLKFLRRLIIISF